jgi:hypothetical protein
MLGILAKLLEISDAGPVPGQNHSPVIIRPFAGKSCFGTDTFPEEGSVGQPLTPRNNIYTNAKMRASVVASRKLARSLYARRLKREPLIRLASLADANMLADANIENFQAQTPETRGYTIALFLADSF